MHAVAGHMTYGTGALLGGIARIHRKILLRPERLSNFPLCVRGPLYCRWYRWRDAFTVTHAAILIRYRVHPGSNGHRRRPSAVYAASYIATYSEPWQGTLDYIQTRKTFHECSLNTLNMLTTD